MTHIKKDGILCNCVSYIVIVASLALGGCGDVERPQQETRPSKIASGEINPQLLGAVNVVRDVSVAISEYQLGRMVIVQGEISSQEALDDFAREQAVIAGGNAVLVPSVGTAIDIGTQGGRLYENPPLNSIIVLRAKP